MYLRRIDLPLPLSTSPSASKSEFPLTSASPAPKFDAKTAYYVPKFISNIQFSDSAVSSTQQYPTYQSMKFFNTPSPPENSPNENNWLSLKILPNSEYTVITHHEDNDNGLIEKSVIAYANRASDNNEININNGANIVVQNFLTESNEYSLTTLIYFFYGIIITIGAVMNIYVIYRMRRFKQRNREQYRNGIGICLCAMAAADLIALVSLLSHFVLSVFYPIVTETLHNALCKLIIFFIHTAYTQSMWCWLFMSALRYIATTRPLQYTTLWRIPGTAISAVLAGAIFENSWLLFTLDSSKESGCIQEFNGINRLHCVFNICFSFVLPTSLVLYMDVIVLFRRKNSKHSDPMLQIVVNRPNVEPKRVFHRFLVITMSNLMLNIPENALRILAVFNIHLNWLHGSDASIFAELSHALFFAQFAFNAFYLTIYVYDKSVLSKTNSSRQLSLSFRQRLEEGSHLIRERASTISYRATTPIPSLARNSSCCALDELYPQKHWL